MEHEEVKPSEKSKAARAKRDSGKSGKVVGWCAKCKAHREIVSPREVTLKNGRKAVEGTCRQCRKRMIRMGKMPGAIEETKPPAARPSVPELPLPPEPRREAVAQPVKVVEDEEVMGELLAAPESASMAGTSPPDATDPYDDPLLYNALQDRVRAGIAKGARTWVKKEGRFCLRFPGGSTPSLGDKVTNLPSPPVTSAKARQAIQEVFAEAATTLAESGSAVPVPTAPEDTDLLAGEPAKSLQQQPFIRQQVDQAVWVNRANNTIGRVAIEVVRSTKLVVDDEIYAALRETSPETYVGLISNGLKLMAQSINDPDYIVRLQSEIYLARRDVSRMRAVADKVLASGKEVKEELLKKLEVVNREREYALALMRPQDKIEFYRQRAMFSIAASPRAGNGKGHAKEQDVTTPEDGEQ